MNNRLESRIAKLETRTQPTDISFFVIFEGTGRPVAGLTCDGVHFARAPEETEQQLIARVKAAFADRPGRGILMITDFTAAK